VVVGETSLLLHGALTLYLYPLLWAQGEVTILSVNVTPTAGRRPASGACSSDVILCRGLGSVGSGGPFLCNPGHPGMLVAPAWGPWFTLGCSGVLLRDRPEPAAFPCDLIDAKVGAASGGHLRRPPPARRNVTEGEAPLTMVSMLSDHTPPPNHAVLWGRCAVVARLPAAGRAR
jgi:hypothetical protein